MRPYLKKLYQEAHENGSPLIRAMFYEFPDDPHCWELQDQYMFGPDYLIAPILYEDQEERDVYLPQGTWKHMLTGELLQGGQTVRVKAPLDSIPVYIRQ